MGNLQGLPCRCDGPSSRGSQAVQVKPLYRSGLTSCDVDLHHHFKQVPCQPYKTFINSDITSAKTGACPPRLAPQESISRYRGAPLHHMWCTSLPRPLLLHHHSANQRCNPPRPAPERSALYRDASLAGLSMTAAASTSVPSAATFQRHTGGVCSEGKWESIRKHHRDKARSHASTFIRSWKTSTSSSVSSVSRKIR